MSLDELKQRLLRSVFSTGLAVALGCVSYATVDLAAYAQDDTSVTADDEDDEFEEEDEEERLVVTGSRIRRDTFTSASPIQVIDGEISRALGLTDTATILQQSNVAQGQQTDLGFSTVSGAITTGGPGSTSINLRGLNANRTLVLVNGRRLAPAGVEGAPSVADLGLIPGTLIDRVEILLDGASSVYGSDAVAGVTNVILRRDFDGLELDAFYSMPELGTGATQTYTATFGYNTDRGYVVFAGEFNQSDEITRGDRDSAFFEDFSPNTPQCELDIEIDEDGRLFQQCSSTLSGFLFGTGFGTAVIPTPGTTNIGIDGFSSTSLDPFNFTGFGPANDPLLRSFPERDVQTFIPGQRRFAFYTAGEYDTGLYGDLTVFFEASFANRQSSARRFGQTVFDVPATYPLNPLGRNAIVVALERFGTDVEVEQVRATFGFKGDLPFMDYGPMRDWEYELYGGYSRSNGFSDRRGIQNETRIAQVLNTARLNENGDPVCDPVGAVTGPDSFGVFTPLNCVVLDFFSPEYLQTGQYPTKEENAFAVAPRISRTVVEQSIVNGFATGTLYDLPAGPLSAVIGFEYRDDEIVTQTDIVGRDGGQLGFFQDLGATGSRSLAEAFFEFDIPVLKDLPFARELTVNAAARYTEEEFFGSAWTWRAQGLYQPVDFLTLRGTYGTSFRAPDTGEQFGLGVTSFVADLDPCEVPINAIITDPDGNQVYSAADDMRDPTVLANCVAQGVDPTSLGVLGLGTPTLTFQGQGTRSQNGGNPDIGPETSRAWSAGLVFEQTFFDSFDLQLAATYWDILVEGQITTLTASQVVADCLNTPNLANDFCSLFNRNPVTGFIDIVNAFSVNAGEVTARGFDINLNYRQEFDILDEVVTLSVFAAGTRALENDQQLTTRVDHQLGEPGFPRWRANFTSTVNWEAVTFLWRTRFIDSMLVEFGEPAGTQCATCTEYRRYDEYLVHDLSLTWAPDTWRLRVGVNNVFEAPPPLVDDGLGGNDNFINGLGHDPFGRTYFVNIAKAF